VHHLQNDARPVRQGGDARRPEGKAESLHFRVNTYLKDLIGRELLTNKYVAVLELVKNSIDAGAANAWIKFVPSLGSPPYIMAIVDDGCGMSKEDVKEKWMNVARSDKRSLLDSMRSGTPYRTRLPVGRKGIGRFSCDRLGETLDMYTREGPASPWNHLRVDWTRFENSPDKDFKDIPVELSEEEGTPLSEPRLEKGTALLISRLRDTWGYDSLLALRRHLQKLIDPLAPEGSGPLRIYIDAPHIRQEEVKKVAKDPAKAVNGLVASTLLKDIGNVATRISLSLDSGVLTTTLYDRGEQLYRLVETIDGLKFLDRIEADVFFLDINAKRFFTRRAGIPPVRYGSIFLYRNGVRVFPYGEPGDDWLQLDKRKQQGYKRFLSSRELLGRVALTDTEGIWEEASSRDSGLSREEPREELANFIKAKAVVRLEKYLVDTLEWKMPSSDQAKSVRAAKVVELLTGMAIRDKNVLSVEYSESLLDAVAEKNLQEGINTIRELSTALDPEKRKTMARYLEGLKESIDRVRSEAEAAKEEALFLEKTSEYVKEGTLRLIAEHNLNIIASRLKPALVSIGRQARSAGLPDDLLEEIDNALVELELLRERNKLVLKASWNIAETVVIDVPSYVEQYLEQYWRKPLEQSGIALEITRGGVSFRKRVLPEVISLALDNLMDNSRKAEPYRIAVLFKEDGGRLVVTVTDDGRGVSAGAAEGLFRPWHSTTAGSGLGLYTTRKLLREHGGDLRYAGNGCVEGMRGACFEVVL